MRSALCSLFVILISTTCVGVAYSQIPPTDDRPKKGQDTPGETILDVSHPRSPIFVRHFFKMPQAVEQTLKDHIVGVSVAFYKRLDNGLVRQEVRNGTALVISMVDKEAIVLTCAHILPELLATWFHETTSYAIYDGHNFFNAFMLGVDPSSDLALLRLAVEQGDVKFEKTPALLAGEQDRNKIPSNTEFFYAYKFLSIGTNIFFPIRVGPYFSETNFVGDEILPSTFIVLGNALEGGFSGGPLIGPDGKVYGVISQITPAYTYAVPVEVIKTFVKTISEQAKPEN